MVAVELCAQHPSSRMVQRSTTPQSQRLHRRQKQSISRLGPNATTACHTRFVSLFFIYHISSFYSEQRLVVDSLAWRSRMEEFAPEITALRMKSTTPSHPDGNHRPISPSLPPPATPSSTDRAASSTPTPTPPIMPPMEVVDISMSSVVASPTFERISLFSVDSRGSISKHAPFSSSSVSTTPTPLSSPPSLSQPSSWPTAVCSATVASSRSPFALACSVSRRCSTWCAPFSISPSSFI